MADTKESPHFAEYLALLRRLRRLIADGRGESKEADRLRDRMDEPWQHLSREEIARIDALAAEIEVPLTEGEIEVVRQMAYGLSNTEIAQKLHISYQTVREHVQHILRKLPVSDRTQATT